MVFSSLSFLIVFLPLLLAVYFLTPARFRRVRNLILLAFSLAFYGCAGLRFLPLMLVSIAINYIGGLLCGSGRKAVRRIGVWSAAALGLALLGYFKYAGFFVRSVNALGASLTVPSITLPIGISFFTFQGLSYVVDVYRGDAAVQKNPLKVALYISLFPQLVAGPIVRYTTVAEEIDDRRESVSEFSAGAQRFCFGLGKKMLLANGIAAVADAAFGAAAPSAAFAWLGAIAYTLQIYFDFSAYSDMAIGLGRMFGFHFLENFNYPYIADSVTDFWRRWHISLSTWFRDYVYIPLGGNRCRPARHIFNLFAVWFLTGLWHGASWNFVCWGLWYFLLLLGEKYVWGRALARCPAAVRHILAMLAVVLGWVLFRADGLTAAMAYLRAMFGANGAFSGQAVYYVLEYWPEWLLGLIAIFPVAGAVQKKLAACRGNFAAAALELGPKLLALALLALSYVSLVSGSFNPFIYFRF